MKTHDINQAKAFIRQNFHCTGVNENLLVNEKINWLKTQGISTQVGKRGGITFDQMIPIEIRREERV